MSDPFRSELEAAQEYDDELAQRDELQRELQDCTDVRKPVLPNPIARDAQTVDRAAIAHALGQLKTAACFQASGYDALGP